MEQFVLDNLSTSGPIAVFALLMLSGFGLALGEEMVTLPAGMLVATGEMGFATTAVSAYVAIVAADCLWFGICRHYGTPLLHRKWFKRLVHPRRLLEAKHQLEKRGSGLIVMARFVPSSRTTAITVAGMFHMPFWKFFAATASCVAVTVPLQLTIGYLVARGVGTESMGDLLLKMLGLLAVVIAFTFAIGWWTTGRTRRRRPRRAKASWLRRFRPPPDTEPAPVDGPDAVGAAGPPAPSPPPGAPSPGPPPPDATAVPDERRARVVERAAV